MNLTPHPVTIINAANVVVVEFPSEGVVRAAHRSVEQAPVAGVPTARLELAALKDLPEPVRGVVLIVSLVTAHAARASKRRCHDLLVPGPGIRDASGTVLGCRQLIWFE